MSKCLPIGEYQWLSLSRIERDFNTVSAISKLNDESDLGYIFEADLHYPAELHDNHNDFPFCPEKRIIPGVTKMKN